MSRVKLIVFIILVNTFTLTGESPDSLKYTALDPYYFHLQFIKDPASILIDVREFFEFRKSRIKDAVNVPMSRGIKNVSDTLPKKSAIFLYCTTGYRSIRAAEILYENGFRNLYVLEGGINSWKKERMPSESNKLRRKPGKHVVTGAAAK